MFSYFFVVTSYKSKTEPRIHANSHESKTAKPTLYRPERMIVDNDVGVICYNSISLPVYRSKKAVVFNSRRINMRKFLGLAFAAAMVLSSVFISGAISSDTSMAAAGQTVTVRRRNRGLARRTYRGGRYVVRRTWDGTKYVSRKVWVATKYTARKTEQGTRWTAHKTKRGAKRLVRGTKRIFY